MEQSGSSNWFVRAYEGKVRLWRVFWFGYMLPLLPLFIAAQIAKAIFASSSSSAWPFGLFALVVGCYYFWALVSLWRCAPNSSHRAYALLARILSIVMVLQIVASVQMIGNIRG